MTILSLGILQDKVATGMKDTGIVLPDDMLEGIFKMHSDEKLCYTGTVSHNGVDYHVVALNFVDTGIMTIAVNNGLVDTPIASFQIPY